MTITCYK